MCIYQFTLHCGRKALRAHLCAHSTNLLRNTPLHLTRLVASSTPGRPPTPPEALRQSTSGASSWPRLPPRCRARTAARSQSSPLLFARAKPDLLGVLDHIQAVGASTQVEGPPHHERAPSLPRRGWVGGPGSGSDLLSLVVYHGLSELVGGFQRLRDELAEPPKALGRIYALPERNELDSAVPDTCLSFYSSLKRGVLSAYDAVLQLAINKTKQHLNQMMNGRAHRVRQSRPELIFPAGK